jgi:hypothetical protein
MKKMIALVFALVAFGFCAPVSAQSNTFDIEGECLAALTAPNGVAFYKPSDLRGTGKMPVDGKVHVLIPLTRDACVHMATTQGWKFVPQPFGTAFRAQRKDGMLVIYARDDCGNPVDGISYPPPLGGLQGLKGDKGERGLRGPRGYRGEPGKDAVLLLPPTSPLKWGFTAGVSRGSYSGAIADRELCKIDNWTANLGLTYGDTHRFFGRLTFMAVIVDDGSSSNYVCTNCGTVTAVSSGMKVLGGNLEAVALVGPRSWKIQPTFYAEVGGGVVLGEVDKYVSNHGSTNVSRVNAEEFFGWKTMAHGGGGAGLTWHASPTVSVEIAGKYRYPYGSSVGIMFTVWQR